MNDQLSNTLAALAQKLGTTVEYLWPKMVRYEVVSGIYTTVIAGVISLGLLGLIVVFIRKAIDNDDPEYCIPAVISFAALLLALMPLHFGILSITCPEAATIKSLLGK